MQARLMRRRGQRQGGHLMVGLVSMMAIAAIMSTVAFQAWEDVVRRDNEAEMMFRAQEIARALLRFQKDQGRLPTKLEELMEPGNRGQYFLRRMYEDPLVPDGKWGLIYMAPGGGLYDPNSSNVEAYNELGQENPQLDPGGGMNLQPGGGPREAEGLPIAGVKSLATDRPFRVYKGFREYEQWTFSILDVQQQNPQQGTTQQSGGSAPPPPPPGGGPGK